MKGFVGARQTTLGGDVVLQGTGVHTGAPARITLSPADADTGIVFSLNDYGAGGVEIPGHYDAISNVTLCTVLSNGNGAAVSTVEHLLAALRGLCIDNALIEIDGGEVPIMDGSAAPFVDAIDEVGIAELPKSRRFIKVLKPVRVEDGDAWAELRPYNGCHLDVEIDFDTSVIGCQRIALDINPGAFRQELARARTFGFMKDVERLWAAGLALGASLENTVAIGDDRVVNQEGLRFTDEFVRHKALDALGDLALAGAPLLGAFRSRLGGHRLNSLVLKALFDDEEAWTTIEAPRAREAAFVDTGFQVAVANYAADRT